MEEKIKYQPTESQIQVLMSDWLGNLRLKDEGNYTHKGKGGIKTNRKGSLTDYLVGPVSSMDQLDLLKEGRHAAIQVVNAVVSEPVDVQIGKEMSFHDKNDSGQHVITLATNYFDDQSLRSREKIDIMLGLAAHESAHAVYTKSELTPEMLNKEPVETMELKKQIWNIIEDERIEYHLGEERPGLSYTLGSTKNYFFKKLLQDLRADGSMPTEPLPKLLSSLTQAVRYPSEMTREDVIENFEYLDDIRKALTPYPMSAEDAWLATDRVMDIVKKVIKKELQEKQQQQQQQSGSQGENQSTSGSGGEQQGNQPQQSSGNQDGQGGSDKAGKQKQPTEKQIRQAIQNALQTKEGQKVMSAITKDTEKASGKNAAKAIVNDSKSQDFVNNDGNERMGGAGSGDPKIFVPRPVGNPNVYNTFVRRIRTYIPAMSKALACKSEDRHYVLHGLPYGKLNTNKLVGLKTGNYNIFDKQGMVKCSCASVCILIDESSSMSGRKLERAREAAILIKESVARIKNVNFFCYGYTSDELTVYAEGKTTDKFALSETKASGGTPTGLAMKYSAIRIRRFSSDPVLMLVLTDGAANDTYEVIRQDNLLRQNGFYPIGVGIHSEYVNKTFKESLFVENISTFAIDLAKLTKGKLDRMLIRSEA